MNVPERKQVRIKGVSFDSQEPINIVAAPPLNVQFLPGAGKRLVICMSGVGRNRGLMPPREFTGSASSGGANHVLFFSDGSRSWMNGPGIAGRIADYARRYCDFHGVDQVVAMGNSMGGFAACVLAELIPVNTVISFSPQFSMHPDVVPEERRWHYWRDRITQWPCRDVGGLDAGQTRYYVFHGDHPAEAQHWLRFPSGPRIHHYIFKGQGHNVAALLRKRQILGQVVDLAIEDRPKKLRKVIENARLGGGFELYYRDAYLERFPEAMQCISPSDRVTPGGSERTAP